MITRDATSSGAVISTSLTFSHTMGVGDDFPANVEGGTTEDVESDLEKLK